MSDGVKHCKGCGFDKDLSEFYKTRSGYQYFCKKCQIRKSSERRKDPEVAEKHRIARKKKHRDMKLKSIEYMGGSCRDCGGIFHPASMEFHHEDPAVKEKSPGNLMQSTWDKLVVELDKCVLLCANCHRRRHYEDSI